MVQCDSAVSITVMLTILDFSAPKLLGSTGQTTRSRAYTWEGIAEERKPVGGVLVPERCLKPIPVTLSDHGLGGSLAAVFFGGRAEVCQSVLVGT
ncbi:hypothetical protein PV08_08396 [Exophiala spinifera]|uniref:Uncharacterized protein n=1 Tax=Exophiala spinifera TaxID=91928 RepID=A0A0D2BQ00_9EURO|nr:uncharacterized protein PV08_08396 [Exophiala spinifera]KIW13209.1 hypothetical protein PV08_08396 [Exophiala spinifera]